MLPFALTSAGTNSKSGLWRDRKHCWARERTVGQPILSAQKSAPHRPRYAVIESKNAGRSQRGSCIDHGVHDRTDSSPSRPEMNKQAIGKFRDCRVSWLEKLQPATSAPLDAGLCEPYKWITEQPNIGKADTEQPCMDRDLN